jgi:hypothetical protein
MVLILSVVISVAMIAAVLGFVLIGGQGKAQQIARRL